jgi:hypothetical protein
MVTAEQRQPKEGESIDQYRIRMLEINFDELATTVASIERLRRDGALALLAILVALAIREPAVWGVVVAAAAGITKTLTGWGIKT